MTDTPDDPRYIRTVGLTLLAALLVVASCEVEQPPAAALDLPVVQAEPPVVRAEPAPIEAEPSANRSDDREAPQAGLPPVIIAANSVADPAATEREPEAVDEVRAAIEALRTANPPEPPPAQAEPQEIRPQELRPEDREAIQAGPVFTPMTVRPEIRNRSEIQQALMREYPPSLRDAGIGGRVVVWYYVSETGQVLHTRLSESSGHAELDAAALTVAAVFRFTPAMNRDERVPVWIQLPITFAVQN